MVSGHASGVSVVGVTVVFTALAVFFCGLRLYARFAVARNAGADDALILLSLLFAIATTVCMIIQVETGMGRHQWDIEPHESITNLKAFYVSIWVYNISLTCTKVSILFQYLRIFPQKPFRIATWTLMAIIIVYGLYVFFTAVFSCWPIAFFWDHTIPGGKCLPRFAIWFANSGLNIATDIATAVLPLPMINKLELPKRQKRALMLVFALGGFTCILSILRLQSLYVIANTKDVSWNNGLAAIWSNVEMNTAILCSCLPTIRCVFPKIFKSQSLLSGSGRLTSGTHPLEGSRPSKLRSFKDTFSVNVSATNGSLHSNHPYRSYNSRKGGGNGLRDDSLEHLEFGITKSKQKNAGSMDDIELGGMHEVSDGRNHADGRIHVFTAIEQEVEKRSESPTDSTKDLVRHKRPYDAI